MSKLKIRIFTGIEQWSEPKLPPVDKPGEIGEVAHFLMSSEEHLMKQVNDWLESNRVEIITEVFYSYLDPRQAGRVRHTLYLRYNITSEPEVMSQSKPSGVPTS